jgi:hypothetical protein
MIFVKSMDIFIRDCIEKIENKYLYMCQFNKFIFIKLAFYHNMCNYIIVDSQELENYCSERFHKDELTKREDYYNFFEQYKIEELCYMDKNGYEIIFFNISSAIFSKYINILMKMVINVKEDVI